MHSHQDHAAALAKILARRRRADAWCTPSPTAATRRRDRPATTSQRFSAALPTAVPIATVIGRYYAMDRDKRWERVAKAYDAIVEAEGAALRRSAGRDRRRLCARQQTDEFVVPAVIGDYRGMQDGDGVLCFNFRADRVREILGALLDPDFDGFPRRRVVQLRRRRRHDAIQRRARHADAGDLSRRRR